MGCVYGYCVVVFTFSLALGVCVVLILRRLCVLAFGFAVLSVGLLSCVFDFSIGVCLCCYELLAVERVYGGVCY